MDATLVLSGGVARGFGHIGVYKALSEFDVKFTTISGASAGAILGAFIAKGFHPEEITEIALQTNIISIKSFNPGRTGLFKPKSIKKNLQHFLGNITFDQLDIELIVAATDIKAGKPFYIRSGELVPALLASSAIPVVYKPVLIDGRLLIDGGISDNFPVEAVYPSKNKIIGSHVNPISEMEMNLGYKALIERCISVVIHKDIAHKKDLCDVFIEPPLLQNFGLFATKKTKQIIETAYTYTKGLSSDLFKF